jgi:hypothetical protein
MNRHQPQKLEETFDSLEGAMSSENKMLVLAAPARRNISNLENYETTTLLY